MKSDTIANLQKALGVKIDKVIGPITRSAYQNKLISIAEKEIGVEEDGKTNSGKKIREYQATTSLGGTGWPWCAAFVCWVYKQSGIFTEQDRPKTASAFGFEDWAANVGLVVLKAPSVVKKGDIVVYRFSHIGIAKTDIDDKGYFKAIEGNTDDAGSREGGCVAEKLRSTKVVRSVIRL